MAALGTNSRNHYLSAMPELDHYQGREQGFVKHAIIEKYLERFTIKIGHQWDQIIYLDAFAGPWENIAEDLSDTSFCIALKQLKSGVKVAHERFNRHVSVKAILIEKNRKAFAKLSSFGNRETTDGFEVTCFNGTFEEQISEIDAALNNTAGARSFLFALIDPKGWTGLSMDIIAPLLSKRSTEVLVNVMTSFIQRFANVESCHDSYDRFFGREGVREIISATAPEDRADAVVREYCRSLRSICGFEHVSSAVVLQPDRRGIKYFMVFGTNSPVGIKVFKEAEAHAASLQDQIKADKEFGDQMQLLAVTEALPVSQSLREKYRNGAFERVMELFGKYPAVSYKSVFCKAMAMPLITEEELLDFINNHPDIELKLDGERRRKPSIDEKRWKDFVVRIS